MITASQIRERAQADDEAAIYELSLHALELTSSVGLERCLKLRSLDLSFNSIRAIEGLELLTDLRELKLHCNRIERVAGLDSLRGLQTLMLHHNALAPVAVAADADAGCSACLSSCGSKSAITGTASRRRAAGSSLTSRSLFSGIGAAAATSAESSSSSPLPALAELTVLRLDFNPQLGVAGIAQLQARLTPRQTAASPGAHPRARPRSWVGWARSTSST